MRQMRILVLDFGSRTVGVAISDGLLLTAQGVETIERKDENKLRQTAARIEALVKEYEVTTIGMGLPKNMNNTDGERVEKKHLELPQKLINIIQCKNPRCITTSESQLDSIFFLSDAKTHTYRCAYCETEESRKKF